MAHIDAHARALLQAKQEARRRVKAGTASELERRVAAHAPVFTVWRTDADLRAWDTTLDPSDRKPGSLWGRDPSSPTGAAWGSRAW